MVVREALKERDGESGERETLNKRERGEGVKEGRETLNKREE